jgi:hypothetical protein
MRNLYETKRFMREANAKLDYYPRPKQAWPTWKDVFWFCLMTALMTAMFCWLLLHKAADSATASAFYGMGGTL